MTFRIARAIFCSVTGSRDLDTRMQGEEINLECFKRMRRSRGKYVGNGSDLNESTDFFGNRLKSLERKCENKSTDPRFFFDLTTGKLTFTFSIFQSVS